MPRKPKVRFICTQNGVQMLRGKEPIWFLGRTSLGALASKVDQLASTHGNEVETDDIGFAIERPKK